MAGGGNEDAKGNPMVTELATKPPIAIPSGGRPLVTSYDSGYEHSLEHWLAVQQLVEAAEAEPESARPARFALAKAS
jgi:hypothetical protein